MATYAEILQASEDGGLRNKARVACVIAAEAIRTEDPATVNHANRLLWAKLVYSDPRTASERMVWSVLAQNSSITYASIIGASDTAVQNAVNTAVNVFATGV